MKMIKQTNTEQIELKESKTKSPYTSLVFWGIVGGIVLVGLLFYFFLNQEPTDSHNQVVQVNDSWVDVNQSLNDSSSILPNVTGVKLAGVDVAWILLGIFFGAWVIGRR